MKAVLFFIFIWIGTLFLCVWASKPLYQNVIERDLQDKLQKATKGVIPKGISQNFNGYQYIITGELETADHVKELKNIASEIGGLLVLDQTTTKAAPKKEPEAPTVETKGALIFTGRLSEREMRDLVYGMARKSNSLVEDTTADDEKSSWYAVLSDFLASYFSKVEDGLVEVSDGIIQLDGVVGDKKAYTEIDQHSNQLADSFRIKNYLEILPWEEATLEVNRKGEKYTVSGVLPDQFTKKKIISILKQIIKNDEYEENLVIGKRVRPAWWLSHSETFMTKLFPSTKGNASLGYDEKGLKVGALLPNAETLALIESIAYRLPANKTSWTKFDTEDISLPELVED